MFHSGLCSCAEALQWAFSASLVFRALCFLGPETDFSGNLFCVTAVSTLDVSGKTLWCLCDYAELQDVAVQVWQGKKVLKKKKGSQYARKSE